MKKLVLAALVALAFPAAAGARHYHHSVAPSNTAPPTISGTAQEGDTLTADPGSWSGTTPISYSYAWSDGATGQTDTLTSSDVGQNVSVTVTASNTAGSAQSTSASVGPVQAASSQPPPQTYLFHEGFDSGQPGYGDLWGGPSYYSTAHAPGWISDCDSSYIHSVSVPDKPTNVGHAQGSDYCQRWYETAYVNTNPVTRVEADVKPLGWGAYGSNASWAGFKFYLRRQAPADATPTYTIEFYIADGQVHIQKGDCNGYGWYPLLEKTVDPTDGSYGTSGVWHHFEGDAVDNPDGSVTLKLIRDGVLVASATDFGGQAGCSSPLHGGVDGFRSDWADYYIDDFTVS